MPNGVPHHRSISLQFFERTIIEPITVHLEAHDFLFQRYFGFRKGPTFKIEVFDFPKQIREDPNHGRLGLIVFEDYSVIYNSLFASTIVHSTLDMKFARSAANLVIGSK